MQCLQPVDPDAQKRWILKQYDSKIQQAIKLFSMDYKRRSIHLFKHVNFNRFVRSQLMGAVILCFPLYFDATITFRSIGV